MKKSLDRCKLTLRTETIVHLTQLAASRLVHVQGGRPGNSDAVFSCSAAETCTATQ
ncbi:MAG TPA: hypothetical protein VFT22_00380 [Kofleriaceae bacterium]|nr:hypothetical protein [Kofleriaceae bacterium]